VLRPVAEPFSADGGLRLLQGNLGRSVVKVSAVAPEHRVVRAPAVVVSDQQDLLALFNAGQLEKDLIAVVRYQGPRANGMPELHKLTPPLAVLQDKGFKVALVTDGRMSGASGKVPAAIHLSPEALADGPIARVMDGDWITLDCERGVLEVEVDAATRGGSRDDSAASRHRYRERADARALPWLRAFQVLPRRSGRWPQRATGLRGSLPAREILPHRRHRPRQRQRLPGPGQRHHGRRVMDGAGGRRARGGLAANHLAGPRLREARGHCGGAVAQG
jgi:hypothetical protein